MIWPMPGSDRQALRALSSSRSPSMAAGRIHIISPSAPASIIGVVVGELKLDGQFLFFVFCHCQVPSLFPNGQLCASCAKVMAWTMMRCSSWSGGLHGTAPNLSR